MESVRRAERAPRDALLLRPQRRRRKRKAPSWTIRTSSHAHTKTRVIGSWCRPGRRRAPTPASSCASGRPAPSGSVNGLLHTTSPRGRSSRHTTPGRVASRAAPTSAARGCSLAPSSRRVIRPCRPRAATRAGDGARRGCASSGLSPTRRATSLLASGSAPSWSVFAARHLRSSSYAGRPPALKARMHDVV